MKNIYYKNGLVIGIIVLLIGVSIIPIAGSLTLKKQVSTNNEIPNITISSNADFIYVGGSGPNNYSKIQDAIDNASDGDTVYVYDVSSPYYGNILVDKSINLIGEDKNTTVLDGDYNGDVVFVSADWVYIKGFTLKNSGNILNDSGVDIRSSNCTVEQNIIINNRLGVDFAYENIDNNKVLNNIIKSNSVYGILAWPYPTTYHCKNLTIVGNKITNNDNSGIWIVSCEYSNISNNILSNNMEGLNMQWHSNNSLISNNIITDNEFYGFWLVYTHRCTVRKNYFKGNGWDGLRVYQHEEDTESSNHSIYHNNILDTVYEEGFSWWDNGYPSGGNYWYDYSGEDKYHGPNQDIPGSDDIGDTQKWKDKYPLMYPMGEQRPVADFSFITDNFTAHFNASSSFDRDGTIISYDWDFGDNTSGTGMIISHIYPENGTYNVTLNVTDNDGNQGGWSQGVQVGNEAPYIPSDPNPQDGDTSAFINAVLTWNCSDPEGNDLTYDVFFGTSSPPPKVISNQTGTSYDPPDLLDFNTTYYWQIIAWDVYDYSSVGLIWSFTTEENTPPNTPSDPDPYDGAIDVDIDDLLYWTGTDPNPGDTVKYDVYFGTSSPPPLEAEDLNWAVYDPFGIDPMELGTVYYWQIVTEDSQGLTTEGPIWHFTTQLGPNDPPGAPTIDGPISGDPGTAYDYKFNAVDPDGDNVKYHIDWGDGNTDETDLNPSGTDVTVPHTWTKSGKYVITAYAEDANGLTGPSSTFQVTMPRDKATNNVLLWRLLEQFPVLQKMFLYFIK